MSAGDSRTPRFHSTTRKLSTSLCLQVTPMDAKEPNLDSPEVIDLSSLTDDEDDDAELKRAIALSLEEQTNIRHDVQNSPQRPSVPLNRNQNPKSPCMTTFGSLLLDRKTMEFERQQRLKRKRDGSSPPAREPPRPASKANLSSLSKKPLESTPQKTSITIREANTISSRSILPFPTGTVKRTWTHGQERRGDDIKIEEVFQKSELKLAVLASFQWDDDWLLSKINLSQTRLICVAFARDEAHVRTNVRVGPPHSSKLTRHLERPDEGECALQPHSILFSGHEWGWRNACENTTAEILLLSTNCGAFGEFDETRLG